MKIASTKTMTDFLNKELKKQGVNDMRFRYIAIPQDVYRQYVNMDVWEAEYNGDFNYKTGKYRAIEVKYPDEYYACNRYLTSNDLRRIFTRWQLHIKNAEDFAKLVIEEMAI